MVSIFERIIQLFFRKRNSNFSESDVRNIVSSMARAKSLHRELILLAHPDRNPGKKIVAEEITKAINFNRYNLKELELLKERINKELK